MLRKCPNCRQAYPIDERVCPYCWVGPCEDILTDERLDLVEKPKDVDAGDGEMPKTE